MNIIRTVYLVVLYYFTYSEAASCQCTCTSDGASGSSGPSPILNAHGPSSVVLGGAIGQKMGDTRGYILFLGDSIFDYYKNKEGKASWDKYFGPSNSVNYAVEGQTSKDVIDQLTKEDIISKNNLNPALTVLLIGTNDVDFGGFTEFQVVENIGEIIKILQEKIEHVIVVVVKILPRFDQGYFNDKQPGEVQGRIKAVNSQLSKYHNGVGVFVIDVGHSITNGDGTMNPTYYLPDGLHLTPEGYEVLSKAILNLS